MSPVLPIFFTPRADREISTANRWWRENRTAAPDLLKLELRRALDLIASHPQIGAPARNTKLRGVRRILLSRCRYHLYYRVTPDEIQVLALWHASRGKGPGL